jgi:hypothetical protein
VFNRRALLQKLAGLSGVAALGVPAATVPPFKLSVNTEQLAVAEWQVDTLVNSNIPAWSALNMLPYLGHLMRRVSIGESIEIPNTPGWKTLLTVDASGNIHNTCLREFALVPPKTWVYRSEDTLGTPSFGHWVLLDHVDRNDAYYRPILAFPHPPYLTQLVEQIALGDIIVSPYRLLTGTMWVTYRRSDSGEHMHVNVTSETGILETDPPGFQIPGLNVIDITAKMPGLNCWPDQARVWAFNPNGYWVCLCGRRVLSTVPATVPPTYWKS